MHPSYDSPVPTSDTPTPGVSDKVPLHDLPASKDQEVTPIGRMPASSLGPPRWLFETTLFPDNTPHHDCPAPGVRTHTDTGNRSAVASRLPMVEQESVNPSKLSEPPVGWNSISPSTRQEPAYTSIRWEEFDPHAQKPPSREDILNFADPPPRTRRKPVAPQTPLDPQGEFSRYILNPTDPACIVCKPRLYLHGPNRSTKICEKCSAAGYGMINGLGGASGN